MSTSTQLGLATTLQLAKVRRTWIFQMLIPSLIAAGTIWLFSRVTAQSVTPPGAHERTIAGAAFVAAMFSTLNSVTHEISASLSNGEIEYLRIRGLRSTPLLISFLFVPVLCSIVPVLAILGLGAGLFHVTPHPSPELPVTIFAGQLLMTALGAALGLALPNRIAPPIAAALPLIIMLFTPVLVPLNALPDFLQPICAWLPSTVLVNLIQAGLFGPSTPWSAVELVAVCAGALAATYLVSRMSGWRGTPA